ncbi:MAG: ATP-binding cassette domain-containing protein [Lachnospiraceae bacterium]|nr:ATP-binding cassette domain-containing protein [Lachnospiraceae bacterium]
MKKTIYMSERNTPMTCGTLYIFNKDGFLAEEVIEDTVSIGRYIPESTADITINCKIISKKQGIIKKGEGFFIYEDTNKSNGTFINGKKYGTDSPEGRTKKVLNDGDILRIDQSNLQKMHPLAIAMIFFSGCQDYKWHELLIDGQSEIEIGRNVSKKRGLSFNDENTSKKHVSFIKGVKHWKVIDHNSTNGVYVNNERIQQPEILNPMDTVRIANTTFLFLSDKILYNNEEKKNEELSINIKERSVGILFRKKKLLEDIHLSIQSGELILILGGSGAGKTTFMNAVMGYEKARGKILHEGVDLYREYSKIKSEIGYVPQKMLLRSDDEVYHTLLDVAEMRMDGYTKKECQQRVEEVLETLGLQSEKKKLVKKLSGGQMRRLAIGVELISDPNLFFLDEPDSGLDGTMAISLMKNLRVIADDGKIVLVITHQPNRVANLFDKVIVLAKSSVTEGGKLAFYGTVPEAYEFFNCNTLEDITKRINKKDEGGEDKADYYINKFKYREE